MRLSFATVRWKSVFLVLAVLSILVHFSLPLVITFDTGHYFQYLRILNGLDSFDSWDRIRQPGYPLFLYFVSNLLGTNQHSFLLIHLLLLLLVVGFTVNFIWKNYTSASARLFGTFFIVVFIILDPLVVGYFHVLLTEAFAATISATSCFLALIWTPMLAAEKQSNRKIAAIMALWIFLLVYSYHLKQTFIFCALFPFIASTVIGTLSNKSQCNQILLASKRIFVALLFLALSIAAWATFLPISGSAEMREREPLRAGTTVLIQGLSKAKSLGSINALGKSNQLNNFPEWVQTEVKELEQGSIYSSSCTRLFQLGDATSAKYSILKCKGDRPNLLEVVNFLVKSALRAPIVTLSSYGESVARLVRLKPSGIATGGGVYSISLENEAIGFKVFTGVQNSFWMPSKLAEEVESLKQPRIETSRGFFGKIPYKWFRGHSQVLFTFVLLILLFSFPFLLIYFVKTVRSSTSNRPVWLFCLAASGTTVFHFAIHIIFGGAIDRYAFPMYFVGLFALGLALVDLVDRLCISGTLRKLKAREPALNNITQ